MEKDQRIPIPPGATQRFTEVAQGSRLHWHMLRSSGDPAPGSNFCQVDDLYPFEKVSVRARHYVSAALEHLIMWADFAAPFKFHPEHTVTFTIRPTLALARAALESAAQAVWLMDTSDPIECVRRHIRLLRWDLEEHRKSQLELEAKTQMKERETQLLERVAEVFTEEDIRAPQGYLWVIQQACRPDDLDLDRIRAERLWRAMSGAAHGMYWTNIELSNIEVGEEYEPGHFRTTALPDADAMTEALEAAFRMAQYATLKYLTFAGAEIEDLAASARGWLAGQITLKPDADPNARQ